MVEDAYVDMLDETLDGVYKWLVEVVAFPFDFSFGDKPEWLDVERLAKEWHTYEGGQDSVGDYIGTIYAETGWGQE